ncbi:Polypyrimidine tract-binding protein 1 [Arabidopsis thaliana]
MSSSGQTQFRYTQTPSKVVHLRNLPWECVEEELIELCKRFGKIVNTKSNVGANRNQAFVEFADLNQAISMVSYYASSSEPAQIRGKTVYIQYSNRHEIVNNQSPGDVPGNVLLVTFEGVESHEVSIDVIHLVNVDASLLKSFWREFGNSIVFVILLSMLYHAHNWTGVFSAFGFVHKIATFEKAAGFQALVQFTDVETASAARSALDGRSIPRYLLSAHVGSCSLRMSYSAHTDLNIKFQSHRSRDYTNPYLPVNQTAMDGSMQPALGADGKKVESQSNVLLGLIENMQYAVTVDVLHTVFSAYGTVQKIAIFEKNGSTQALIQYSDIPTAAMAKEALEGHCIYDGGYCKLRLSYSRHTDLNVKAFSDKSRDYTLPDLSLLVAQKGPAVLGSAPPAGWQNPQAQSQYSGYGGSPYMYPSSDPNGASPSGQPPYYG